MSGVAVHQFIPTLAPHDAIGTHVVFARDALRAAGMESEIYADSIAPGAEHVGARRFTDFTGGPDRRTFLLYQLSTSSRLVSFLMRRPEPKLVNYHNITPGRYFWPWEPHIGLELDRGREQLRRLAPYVQSAIAVSAYNERDLAAARYRTTSVAPVLVDLAAADVTPDEATTAALKAARARGGSRWLFVGRISPHKAQHEIVKALHVYRQLYDPQARLTLIGALGSSTYVKALRKLITALGLADAVRLQSAVPQNALVAHYREADVFVCCSRHEGFCVPLVEAMWHGLPVVTHAVSALPDTAGDAAVVLAAPATPAAVAAAVHRVLTDDHLRSALTGRGRERARRFDVAETRDQFTAAVAGAVGVAVG